MGLKRGNGLMDKTRKYQIPTDSKELEDLKKLYLKILEDSVPHSESLWTEAENGAPNAGFFDFRKYKNWMDNEYATVITIPGNGAVSLTYAVLLKETNKDYFSVSRIPRSIILEHVIKAIRWCCLTSAYVKRAYQFLPYIDRNIVHGNQWCRPIGTSSDQISHLMLATAILWDNLGHDTQELVRDVAIGCAARRRKCYSWDRRSGGEHDKIIFNLLSTMPAAYMFPNHKDNSKFMSVIKGAGINLVSTIQDKNKEILVERKLIKKWIKGWNLYPDCSSNHHSHASPYYCINIIFEARTLVELFARIFNNKVPETYTYPGNNFDGVLEWAKILFTRTGEIAYPHGVEYDSYYGGAAISAFSYGSTILKDKISLHFEKVAAQLLYKHNQAIKQYDFHRPYSIAAIAYLMHKFNDNIENTITLGEAFQSLCGVYHYKYQRCLVHHTPEKWVSFSWGTILKRNNNKGFCGLVIPQNYDLPAKPLIYCHPNSLTGELKIKSSGGLSINFKNGIRFAVSQFVLKKWGIQAVAKIGRLTKHGGDGKSFRGYYLEKELNKFSEIYVFDKIGFSTAGKVDWMRSFEQKQAFFSFQEGPCVILLTIDAIKDCELESWSGLPIYLYKRDGLTGTRKFYYECNNQVIDKNTETTVKSNWFCVNDQIGMSICGGNNKIKISPGIGFNWSRKESYRDKYTMISASPLQGKNYKNGENLIDLGVVIYPNIPHKTLEEFSKQLRTIKEQLPLGWKGLICQGKYNQKLFTIVNFNSKEEITKFNLPFSAGAPIFEEETLIKDKQATVEFKLKKFNTIRKTLKFFLEISEAKEIKARVIGKNEIKIININHQALDVTLKYFDKDARYHIKILNEKDKLINQAIVSSEIFQNKGFKINLKGKYIIVKVEVVIKNI